MSERSSPLEVPKRPGLSFEAELWAAGFSRVGGLDEAGRGSWAGPVCAAVVILPPEPVILERLAGVRDSKQMSARARVEWARRIRAEAHTWGIGFAESGEIDAINILAATRLAMRRALENCYGRPEHLLIDALLLPECAIPQTALVKGDARVLSIAAASVLAKTVRDELMIGLEECYPGYEFARHKGYGTPRHKAALERLGPCEIHRMSFAPVAKCLSSGQGQMGGTKPASPSR
jgi:ribonuclease HII